MNSAKLLLKEAKGCSVEYIEIMIILQTEFQNIVYEHYVNDIPVTVL